jgi:tetratricopeptide (TPR) repeat protein
MGLTEVLLVIAVGGGIIAVLFATFKGAASDADAEERGTRAAAAAISRGAKELEERRRATLLSLEEIEADFEAGDYSEADYDSLRRRYESELARLEDQIAAGAAAPEAGAEAAAVKSGGSGWTTAVGWGAGTIAFVALAWLVMSQALRPRSEDGSITGSIPGEGLGSSAPGVAIAPVDQEALAALERAVAENPNDVEALVELGHLYLRLQRNDALSAVTQQALALDPQNPEALTHMGMLLFSMGHPEGVMPSFDRALEADPNFGEALQFKGMVAFMGQDYPTAVDAWDRYIEVVPAEEVPPRITAMLEMARANAGAAEGQ